MLLKEYMVENPILLSHTEEEFITHEGTKSAESPYNFLLKKAAGIINNKYISGIDTDENHLKEFITDDMYSEWQNYRNVEDIF